MCRTTEAINAIHKLISSFDSHNAIAGHLGINSAHLSMLIRKGHLTQTLEGQLVQHGYLDPRPTRTRLAIDCERSTRQWFRDEAARREMTGEAFLLYMRRCMEREEGRS